MLQLLMVIHGLTLEVNTQGELIPTSRAKGDPFKVAKRNGWTFETGNGTIAARTRCLRDCLGMMLANDPNYEVSHLTVKALGEGGVLDARSLAQSIRAENGL